jgi:hypothetical protein
VIGFLFSKVRSVLLGLAVIAGPLLYLLGSFRGKQSGKIDALKDELDEQTNKADFYRNMEAVDENDIRPRNRNDLIERLRKEQF